MESFSKLFYKSLSSYSTVKKPMNKNSELINYGFFYAKNTCQTPVSDSTHKEESLVLHQQKSLLSFELKCVGYACSTFYT